MKLCRQAPIGTATIAAPMGELEIEQAMWAANTKRYDMVEAAFMSWGSPIAYLTDTPISLPDRFKVYLFDSCPLGSHIMAQTFLAEGFRMFMVTSALPFMAALLVSLMPFGGVSLFGFRRMLTSGIGTGFICLLYAYGIRTTPRTKNRVLHVAWLTGDGNLTDNTRFGRCFMLESGATHKKRIAVLQ